MRNCSDAWPAVNVSSNYGVPDFYWKLFQANDYWPGIVRHKVMDDGLLVADSVEKVAL